MPGDTRHAAGAGDEQEAERAHAAEQIGVGPFAEERRRVANAASRAGAGLHQHLVPALDERAHARERQRYPLLAQLDLLRRTDDHAGLLCSHRTGRLESRHPGDARPALRRSARPMEGSENMDDTPIPGFRYIVREYSELPRESIAPSP